jgi:hypothetical protein
LENSGINYLRNTFRAHFLASIPASILIALFLLKVSEKYGKVAFSIPFFSVIFLGGMSGIFAQFENSKIAEQSKYIQRSIVKVAPYISDNSLLVLINLPDHGLETFCQASNFDPYGDSMWFNSALKVLYPTTKLVGIYYAENNSDFSKKSIIFKAKESSFSLISSPVTVDFNHVNLDHVLVFDYKKIGTNEFLLRSINTSTIPGLYNIKQYSPLIQKGTETNYSPIFYKNIDKIFSY